MPWMIFTIPVETSGRKCQYQKNLTENSLNNGMFILCGE